jgi:uncharacterized protein YdeI (BOF family)
MPSQRPPPVMAPPAAPYEEEEDEEAQTGEDQAASPPPASSGSSKVVLFAALGVVALLVLGAVGFFLLRGPATGFLLVNVDLPAEARKVMSVTLTSAEGTQTLAASPTGSIVQPVPAGPAVVQVSAEGYEPFTQKVDVLPGQQVTQVQAALKRSVRTVSLVLSTRPDDAEVKVDGKVLRPKGSQDFLFKDLPAGDSLMVEVSAPGFKPFKKTFAYAETLQVKAMLEAEEAEAPKEVAVRVESTPAGATIFAGGKDLGVVTPATVKLSPSVKRVELRLRCYTDAAVDVESPSSGEPSVVKGSLKKIPRCR